MSLLRPCSFKHDLLNSTVVMDPDLQTKEVTSSFTYIEQDTYHQAILTLAASR